MDFQISFLRSLFLRPKWIWNSIYVSNEIIYCKTMMWNKNNVSQSFSHFWVCLKMRLFLSNFETLCNTKFSFKPENFLSVCIYDLKLNKSQPKSDQTSHILFFRYGKLLEQGLWKATMKILQEAKTFLAFCHFQNQKANQS